MLLRNLALLLLLFSCHQQILADVLKPPEEFKSVYALSRGILEFGTTTRSLKQNSDNTYTFQSKTKAVAALSWVLNGHVEETSTWTYRGGQIVPLKYKFDKVGGKKRNELLTFDWDKNIVTNSMGPKPWRIPVDPGTMDKHLYQLVIIELLKKGKTTFNFQVADRGKIKPFDFKVVSNETVETPLGTFDAVKIKRIGDKRKTIFWCVKELDYFAVKITQIEKDGERYIAVLENFNGATNAKQLQALSGKNTPGK